MADTLIAADQPPAQLIGIAPGPLGVDKVPFRLKEIRRENLPSGAATNFVIVSPSAGGYALSPTSQTFPAGGGTGAVSVTAGTTCAWTATSNQSWVSITAGGSGTGNGTVSYSVEANTTGSRQATVTIAGIPFTVNQDAPPADLYLQNLTRTSGIWLYLASNSVVAENGVTVGGSAGVTFQAGNSIRLGPGFHATAGSAATTFRTVVGP